MLTGVGDSVIFGRTTLLARLSDSNEETTNIDDSFDYLEGGIAEGELYEVSSSCRPSKCIKWRKKPAKTWKNGAGFAPKAFKTFDYSSAGIQVPYKHQRS